jgi:phosphate transport system substrate-binding protein
VERSQDRPGQCRRDPARRHHHPRVPLGRIGHHERVHDLPLGGVGDLEVGPRRRRLGAWPVGQGGKGNEGVAALVKQVPNAIGYVEYAYAKQIGIPVAQLQNKDGRFVAPEAKTFQAAAANANWSAAPGFGISLTNQPGAEAWPITAPTFILVPKTPEKPEQVAEVLKFFDWAYKNGDTLAAGLDYVPLPDAVVEQVRKSWGEIKTKAGQPVFAM